MHGQKKWSIATIFIAVILPFSVGLILVVTLSKNSDGDIRSRASGVQITNATVCPASKPYGAVGVIPSYQLTYPAIVKLAGNTWMMLVGGIATQIPASMRSQANLKATHIRYPEAQEELWRMTSNDLIQWSPPVFSFGIYPDTPVSFKQQSPYKGVYPNAFKLGCTTLTASMCNVQINDASVVRFNNVLYAYFSILENYRWYDRSLGNIGPSNPSQQNKHAIGLAVSGDEGKSWAFVDKVITESPKDADGNSILGAWAPSAVVTKTDEVQVYFHDALGTKQYVGTLKDGASLTRIDRLNKADSGYRVNLDVTKNGTLYEVVYNDAQFNIVRTFFSNPADFGRLCKEEIIVPASADSKWPTPHQVIDNGKVHLFFWKFSDASVIHHWVRAL